jgi:prepilin-type N-terminal cleavage/methylation domain-containing protein
MTLHLPARRLQLLAARQRDDSGFTLIEVLTAIVLLGIVTTAALAFSIQAVEATAAQERRSVASAVATNAMEDVNSNISVIDSATGVSYLMAGRTQTAINSLWGTYSAWPGVSNTYPGWDPSANNASVPRVPVQSVVERNGTDYTVTTLIGWCYKPLTGGDCTRIPAVTTPPVVAPSGWANRLIRVTTIVEWSAGSSCEVTACSYQVITLVDATSDLEWTST